MSEIDQVAHEIERSTFELIVPLQTTKEIKQDAFVALDKAARDLARLLKGSELIPRKILANLDMAAGILEAEAPYSRDQALVLEMSRKLRLSFGLILGGECQEDRQPGAPRVR
ncbi:MAG: hypothetical protein WCH44_14855 [Betaproteobacteria bacterium]